MSQIDDQYIDDTDDDYSVNEYDDTYRTNDVASMLNETPAMIRYYCSTFKDFLPVEQKGKGAHRRFTRENIEMLKKIIDMKNGGKPVKEILQYLNSYEGIMETVEFNDKDIAAKKLADYFTEYMFNNFSKEIENALADVKTVNNEFAEELYNRFISEHNQQQQDYQTHIDTLNKRIDELTEYNSRVLDHTSKLVEFIDEQTTKKKKGLFRRLKRD